ncbi:hypothetical protein SC1_00510 [Sphingopyxis sp. C-1]|nr:hypothetical protein SC1_00510 [Sphingopyxis sp. C-1]
MAGLRIRIRGGANGREQSSFLRYPGLDPGSRLIPKAVSASKKAGSRVKPGMTEVGD